MSTSTPPGITSEGTLVEVHVGANDASWQWVPYQKVKLYTNAFIVQNGKVSAPFLREIEVLTSLKILLGYKKRGFGQGM